MDLAEVLDRAQRCVLGFAGQRGPLLSPLAFWADGAALWMSTPAVSVKALALRRRPLCTAYVPPPHGIGEGAMVTGHARVYGLHDPLGLAVHAPLVSAAMSALAARNAGTILGYVQDSRLVPARFRPHNRVAVRLLAEEVRATPTPQPGPGVAPALPPVVAAEVRRALSGQRVVVLATQTPGERVSVTPAVWGAGFALQAPAGVTLPSEAAATVHVGSDPRSRPTAVVGLSLAGRLRQGRLEPQRATWWEGFELRTADVPPPNTSTLTLPD